MSTLGADATAASPRGDEASDKPDASSGLLRRRRGWRRWLAGLVAVGVGATAVTLAATRGGRDAPPSRTKSPPTAAVQRRDLVERQSFQGTLGYTNKTTLSSRLQGTITWLPGEGKIVRRGGTLWKVDDRPVSLLYGARPAWRTLAIGIEDGKDVQQLEENLVAMGYDPYGEIDVDDHFDAATQEAVKRWQEDLGVEDDGAVEFGEIVFLPGPARIGSHKTSLGAATGAATPVEDVSSTTRAVTFDAETDWRPLLRIGEPVEVEMPDGRIIKGTIVDIGKVATTPADDEAEPTVEVTVSLARNKRAGHLDQAPVDVRVASNVRKNALSVPVSALLALAEGGYAVEVVEGARRTLVAVDTGVYADGWVEISGKGVAEGTKVVVPE